MHYHPLPARLVLIGKLKHRLFLHVIEGYNVVFKFNLVFDVSLLELSFNLVINVMIMGLQDWIKY